jgi:hypothetical protein
MELEYPLAMVEALTPLPLKSSTSTRLAHSPGAELTPACPKATNSGGAVALALSSLPIGTSESGAAMESTARIRTGNNMRGFLNQTLSIILYSDIHILRLVSAPNGPYGNQLAFFAGVELIQLDTTIHLEN